MITKATYIYPRTLRMRMQLRRRIHNCYDSDPGFNHYHRRGRRGGEKGEEQERGRKRKRRGEAAGFRCSFSLTEQDDWR